MAISPVCYLGLLRIPHSQETLMVLGSSADLALWSSIEVNVAVICCCLPLCRPLVRKILPNQFSLGSNNPKKQSIGKRSHDIFSVASKDIDGIELIRPYNSVIRIKSKTGFNEISQGRNDNTDMEQGMG